MLKRRRNGRRQRKREGERELAGPQADPRAAVAVSKRSKFEIFFRVSKVPDLSLCPIVARRGRGRLLCPTD